ncbi:hypothetical protein KY285_010287 [Solanum tuberosum]|nr:hypothetical protein KY289_010828 [Solanum tuberosum]KAH0734580.1 hypothetical protein KY285_010287 [Solanum tuberosum]
MKKNFTPFRCVGCRATSQVSVPAPIADWQSKKKKQKLRIKTLKFVDGDSTFSTHSSCCRKGRKTRHSCMAASFDDFVVSRKPHSAKGRVDIDKELDLIFDIEPLQINRIRGTSIQRYLREYKIGARYVPVKFYPAIIVFFSENNVSRLDREAVETCPQVLLTYPNLRVQSDNLLAMKVTDQTNAAKAFLREEEQIVLIDTEA